MAESAPKILEGVFAICKPPSLSSAQVLRDLQSNFAKSETFAPLLEDTRRKQEEQERHQRKKRKRGSDAVFKMGHGGTLDPLATGVLIVGIGRGTKHLQNFLGCTKTYETVVLFGKTTDTYDVAGKIVGEAEYKHITKESVESKLDQFRGKIRQVPPVYSALKINGMKAYEYAREGKELPRELESREMQVDECTLLEWYNGGEHDYRWPAEEAPEDEKRAVSKLMGTAEPPAPAQDKPTSEINQETLQSTTQSTAQSQPTDTTEVQDQQEQQQLDPTTSASPPQPTSPRIAHRSSSPKAPQHTHDATLNLSSTPSPSPAALIRLTVSSGFYVRSFAHDLGLALSSAGIMASLLRSRQASYTTLPSTTSPSASPPLTPALTYADLDAGEETWGPKITAQLESWMSQNPADQKGYVDGRDPRTKQRMLEERGEKPRQRFRGGWEGESKGERIRQQGGKWKGKWNEGGNRGRMFERGARGGDGEEKRERERNSSSVE